LASGQLKGNGVWGTKRDFYYGVPSNVYHVSLRYMDLNKSGFSIINGNGKATLSWTKGSRWAKVHAWVNGKVSWWGKKSNHIAWTVWAWTK
jgi:hypothetical protein